MARAEYCESCGKTAFYPPEPMCRACNAPVSLRAPNVWFARNETEDLQRRYEEAREQAGRDGRTSTFASIEALGEKSQAVLAVGIGFAHHLLVSEELLYGPYAKQTRAGLRAPAPWSDDQRRRTVESWLFGGYGSEVVYAALAANGVGLVSYGDVHLTLDEKTVAHRASLLEENSFDFTMRHRENFPEPAPKGFRSTWRRRGQLAAAKLGPAADPEIDERDLPKLLLSSEGDRSTDDFIEVHIYGSFNWQALDSLKVTPSESLPEADETLLKVLEAKARSFEIWNEV